MSSSESLDLANPRKCFIVRSVTVSASSDWVFVRISPPLIGQKYGLGGASIDLVVLAPRLLGHNLLPITKWPVHVTVARMKIAYVGQNHLEDDDLVVEAWAELFSSEALAEAEAKSTYSANGRPWPPLASPD